MREDENRTFTNVDMAIVDDESLIVLAKECDYSPARDEILVRYSPETERLVQWLARSTPFDAADVEDARQNAVFWTVEAISKFDTDQMTRVRRCSFHSFLYRVLVARFKDYRKHIHRIERKRHLTSANPEEEGGLGHLFCDPNDPAILAETQEALDRVQAAVASLDDESRKIWQQLCDGQRLREIAVNLDISYDAAKRRRRKLIANLKLHLRQEYSGGEETC